MHLPVSPMYTLPHSQGILYPTLLVFVDPILCTILELCRISKQIVRHAVIGNDEVVGINVLCTAEPL